MKLEDAIEAFAIGKLRDDSLTPVNVLDISSGGPVGKDHTIPALYAKPEDAIAEWFRTLNFIAMGYDGAPYRWIDPPKLETYQITMQDSLGTHRIVSDRYTVSSKITFGA